MVEASGADIEETLVNFLAEILYRFDTEKFIAKEVEVRELTAAHVTALLRGEALDPARHEFKHHIKAVTFHDVHVTRGADGFEVTITCDV
jgi:SHS2 domain-containing protein